MPLGTMIGLGPGRIVLHGDPAPPSKSGRHTQFSTHVYCDHTVTHLSTCLSTCNPSKESEERILMAHKAYQRYIALMMTGK